MRNHVLSIVAVFCLLNACNRNTVSDGSIEIATYRFALLEIEKGRDLYTNCQFSEAMDAYYNALKALDSVSFDPRCDSLYGIIYQYISDVFSDCEMHETAKEVIFKALNYSLRAEDSLNIATSYRKIGNLCYYLSEIDNPDTMLYYFQKSLPYVKGEDPYYSALYMALIGIYKDKGDISMYMPIRGNGIKWLPKDFNERLPLLNNYIAWCLWVLGTPNEAIVYAKKSAVSNNMKQQMDAFDLLGKLYLEVGDTMATIINTKKLDSLNIVLSEAKRKAAGIEKAFREYETEKTLHWKTSNVNNTIYAFCWITGIIILIVVLIIIVFHYCPIKKNPKCRDKNKFSSLTLF